MADPVYTLGVELEVGSLTQLQSLCLRGSFSQSIADSFHQVTPDRALFELANEVGSLSPLRNSNLALGRKVALTATYGGSSFNLYAGRIVGMSTKPNLASRNTVIEAITDVDRLSKVLLRTGVLVNRNVSSLFTEIMTRSNVASFVAGPAVDVVPFAWYQDHQALNAVKELAASGPYEFTVDGAGTMILREEQSAIWSSPTLSPVASLSEAYDLEAGMSASKVINSIRISATPRAQQTAISTIGYLPQPITIPASSSIGFFVPFFDPRNIGQSVPVGSIVALVSSQDYYAALNSDGSGANMTSTLSVNVVAFASSLVCSLFNGVGSEAQLTRFQVRGYPILEGSPVAFSADQSSSQAAFGVLSREIYSLVADRDFIQNYAYDFLLKRAQPAGEVSLALVNDFPNVVNIRPGDVLTVVDSLTGVGSYWVPSTARHSIDLINGLRHEVRYELDPYRGQIPLAVEGATFSGTMDCLVRQSGGLVGASYSKKGLLSWWQRPRLEPSSGAAILTTARSGGGNYGLRVNILGSDPSKRIQIIGTQDNGTDFAVWGGQALCNSSALWSHQLWSWDLTSAANAQSVQAYVNDVEEALNLNMISSVASTFFPFTSANSAKVSIGADAVFVTTVSGDKFFKGDLAEVYFTTERLDLSIIGNRRKFIGPTGKPVDLGTDGSKPTGTPPLIYQKLAGGVTNANSFGLNYGSGGNFTVAGSLGISSTSPSD